MIAPSVFSDVYLLPVCNVNKTMFNRYILNFREWFRATNQMKYMYRQKMSRIIYLTRRQREILHANDHKRNTSDHSRYVDVTHANKTQYQRDESSINRHNSVTNATVMPPNQDEINLSGNYNSNRQTLLEDGRQIQDVHNSYSPIHTARFTGNSNTHDQIMENYHRTLNWNYRRNPQHRQNGNTHKQRYRDYL